MKEKEVILLTGASGFVGQAILAALEQRCSIRVALRNPDSSLVQSGFYNVVVSCARNNGSASDNNSDRHDGDGHRTRE